MAISVGGNVLTDDADLDILAWGFDRDSNIDSYGAANSQDQTHRELSGGTNTLNITTKLIGGDPKIQAEELLALESRADPGCPNRPILFNQFANDLVPAADNTVTEFDAPVMFSGLFGGTAHESIMSEDTWNANTYERVTSLPITPATFASDAGEVTATTVDLIWDLDVEKYVRQAGLDRIQYFEVFQSETTGGPISDPYVLVPPVAAPGIPNSEDPTTLGKVRFTVTGLTTATTYFFIAFAVDQYGMRSAASVEASQLTA